MKTRQLRVGEHFQAGDFHVDGMTAEAAGLVGDEVLVNCWRRPIKEDNWIAFSDRKPTKEDALNASHGSIGLEPGDILIRFYDGSCVRQKWDKQLYVGTDGAFWMPLNFIPREPTRIKVDGHEVVPNRDGSIKVGCQTVSSQDFEEIVRQRSEAMK